MNSVWRWVAIVVSALAVAGGQLVSTVFQGPAKTAGIALALVGGAILLVVVAQAGMSGLPGKRKNREPTAPGPRPGPADGGPSRKR